MSRASLLLLLVFALAEGCSPRPKETKTVPTPPPGANWKTVTNRDGVLEKRGDAMIYRDGTEDFELTIPPGFTARLTFVADPTGPPVEDRGSVRVRLSDDGAPACVIDVAVEPLRPSTELGSWIEHGRERFFLAETGEPVPALPVSEVWTATLVPVDPTRIDLGYWLFARDFVLRVEGRFPITRLGACKEPLDAVVRSATSTGRPEAGAGARGPG